jgi:hypothetical protein
MVGRQLICPDAILLELGADLLAEGLKDLVAFRKVIGQQRAESFAFSPAVELEHLAQLIQIVGFIDRQPACDGLVAGERENLSLAAK